jgi:hypothetical protein
MRERFARWTGVRLIEGQQYAFRRIADPSVFMISSPFHVMCAFSMKEEVWR